jgi:hypothetical protein
VPKVLEEIEEEEMPRLREGVMGDISLPSLTAAVTRRSISGSLVVVGEPKTA